MIEVEGKVTNQPVVILFDLGEIHSFIDPKIVDRFHLMKSKFGRSWLVQLVTRTKRRINKVIRGCLIDLNGVNTNLDLNIIPLGSYNILIGVHWLDKHHAILYYHNKKLSCLDEEGRHNTMKGIRRSICIRNISAL